MCSLQVQAELSEPLPRQRQLAHALAGRGEDRVAERREHRRHARLAHARRQRRALDEVHAVSRGASFMRATWKSWKLLCWIRPLAAVISPVTRQADGHHRRALHLRPHAVGVDDHAGVHDLIDARHAKRPRPSTSTSTTDAT